jgi:hypothetical protein
LQISYLVKEYMADCGAVAGGCVLPLMLFLVAAAFGDTGFDRPSKIGSSDKSLQPTL